MFWVNFVKAFLADLSAGTVDCDKYFNDDSVIELHGRCFTAKEFKQIFYLHTLQSIQILDAAYNNKTIFVNFVTSTSKSYVFKFEIVNAKIGKIEVYT